MKNVPRGLYRNHQGIELTVTKTAMSLNGHNTLSGDIAVAQLAQYSPGYGPEYLVTEASLADCGYELIEAAKD